MGYKGSPCKSEICRIALKYVVDPVTRLTTEIIRAFNKELMKIDFKI